MKDRPDRQLVGLRPNKVASSATPRLRRCRQQRNWHPRSRGCRCEPPFFSAFCLSSAGRGAGFARGFLERMMDAIQRAVPVPQAEVIMHGASGRQIRRAPLAAGAQNVHHAVDHLADSDAPFAAAGLARRDQRRYAPIPHRSGRSVAVVGFVEQIHHPRESQLIQLFIADNRIRLIPDGHLAIMLAPG